MNLKLILSYLNYQLTSFTEHDLHSPFVYNFYMELIKNKNPYDDFEKLNNMRKELLLNETVLSINDFGAGSKTWLTNQRKIKQITKQHRPYIRESRLILHRHQMLARAAHRCAAARGTAAAGCHVEVEMRRRARLHQRCATRLSRAGVGG